MLADAFLSTSPSDSALGQWSFRSWAEKCQNMGSWSQSHPPPVLWVQSSVSMHVARDSHGWAVSLHEVPPLLPWTDPSSAWPLSAAPALSPGREEPGQCWRCCDRGDAVSISSPWGWQLPWQPWWHPAGSCSEALQTILPPPGGITGMCTGAFPLAWNDSYYQHKNRRWGWETNPYVSVLS